MCLCLWASGAAAFAYYSLWRQSRGPEVSVAVCFCKRGTLFERLSADEANFYDASGTGWVVCVCGGGGGGVFTCYFSLHLVDSDWFPREFRSRALTDLPGSDLSLPPRLLSPLHLILNCWAHYSPSSVAPVSGFCPRCCHWHHHDEIIRKVMKFSVFFLTLKITWLSRREPAEFACARLRVAGLDVWPAPGGKRSSNKTRNILMLQLFRCFTNLQSPPELCFIYLYEWTHSRQIYTTGLKTRTLDALKTAKPGKQMKISGKKFVKMCTNA